MARGPCTCSELAETDLPKLESREEAVLDELARDCDAWIAFSGLRRRLGLHQQILTRTLHRLERGGLVARTDKGYHLTELGCASLTRRPSSPLRGETVTVVQALLPPDLTAEDVQQALGHRWFGGLRWFGQTGAPGESTLTWTGEKEPVTVRIRVHGAALSVELEAAPGASAGAFRVARPIIAAIAALYALPAPRDPRTRDKVTASPVNMLAADIMGSAG